VEVKGRKAYSVGLKVKGCRHKGVRFQVKVIEELRDLGNEELNT
jgi:hypothetical protein